jgi:aryl-alcohol dehydrogenase-like predicted oxidoreductase
MDYCILGRSGLRVSRLCLGAMTFGEEFGIGADAAESRRVFDAYRDAGGNFIDTANIYNRGTSERLLAGFIAGDRARLVIASKYTLSTDGADPNAGGSHRKNLVQALDASLRRLQTDYLDVFWVHGWDRHTAMEEVMRGLDDQVRLGKVLHIGFSNAPAWIIAMANTVAVERHWTPFTALQLHYNLVERSIEADMLPLAAMTGMAVTAWSPLAGGLLTGKYAGESSSGRLAGPAGARTLTERNVIVARRLAELAAELGCTPAQLSLAWVCQHPSAIIPIIGARSVTQLRENLGCLEIDITAPVAAALDGLSPPVLRYPESLLAGDFFRTMMYGKVRERVHWPDEDR